MADGNTPTYNLILPEIDGADGTWGISLNSNLGSLDSLLSGGTALSAITVTGTVTTGGVTLGNNQKIKLGGDASPNLEIFESTGGDAVIRQVGTGNIAIQGQNGYLKNDADNALVAWDADHSELSWQGATGAGIKLATTETGIDVTGKVTCDGIISGANPFEIINNVATRIVSSAGEARFNVTDSGASLLYGTTAADVGEPRLAITATGVDVTGTVDLDNLTIATDQGTAGQVLKSTGSGIEWGSDSGGNETLAQTLALGNATGGTDIVLTDGDVITGTADPVIKPPPPSVGYGSPSIELQTSSGVARISTTDIEAKLWYGATAAASALKLQTTDAGIDVTGTVEADDLKLPLFTSTSVTTNGSLDPVQVPYASTQDTLALLAVDPSGNVVKGSQEGTWTFTKAQLDALTTTSTSGVTLLSAAGSDKAVIVEESNWMIKYSGTGTMSANGFEVRQAHNGASDAGITRIPSGQINTIMSGLPTGNPSYGFYSRDLPLYNNDGRSYVTNKATFLNRINTNATPANLISISIKLKYRVFDVDTF